MKLASFSVGGKSSYGAVVDDGVVDLGKKLKYPTLLSAIKAGALEEVKKAAAGASPDHKLSAVTLDVPMPDVESYICVGRNYKAHVAEGGAGAKAPDFPSTFIRLRRSIVAHDQPLIVPKVSGDFDYEGELAFVIGKGGRHIKREDALSHIVAYSILQEGSIRDYQFKHCLIVGKNFYATGSFGPYLVTADEVGDPTKLHMSTRLNGQEVQHTGTGDLIFDIPYIISYFSSFMPLEPGDVISTGTPEGVGFARKPPLWMKAGDTLEVEISKLGILRNKVVAE